MYKARRKSLTLVSLSFVALVGTAFAQSKSANLYQLVITHKDKVAWRPATNPPLPSEVCSLLSACTEAGPVKFFTLPPATIDGRQVGRAIYLTRTNNKDALILERQTRSDAYFFLLSPDGNLQKAVYLEQGKPYYLVSNELAQPKFDQDKKDWIAWAMKIG